MRGNSPVPPTPTVLDFERQQKQRTDIKSKAAVLVCGMHRSGTSAVARTLNLLGCSLPVSLIPGRPSENELGFWESQTIVELNKEILASGGSAWDDCEPFDPGWYQTPVADAFREQAGNLLASEFGTSRFFVLKDPRICRILPFWIEAIEAFDATPFIVCPIRNPFDVATSLNIRDRIAPARALLIWLRHVLDSELASRSHRRTFVRYEDLLDEWKGATNRVGEQLGLVWPRRAAAGSEIDAFLAPDLRHHAHNDAAVFNDTQLSPWVRRSFEILDRWAHDDVRDGDEAELDRIRAGFDDGALAFGRAIAAGLQDTRQKRKLERDLAGLSKQLDTRQAELAKRSADVGRLETEIRSLAERLEAEQTHARGVSGELDARRAELAKRSADVGRLETEIRSLAERLEAEQTHARGLSTELDTRQAELAKGTEVARRLETEVRNLTESLEVAQTRVAELSSKLGARQARIENLEALAKQRAVRIERLEKNLGRAKAGLERSNAANRALKESVSWRITAPIREIGRVWRRLRKRDLVVGQAGPVLRLDRSPEAKQEPARAAETRSRGDAGSAPEPGPGTRRKKEPVVESIHPNRATKGQQGPVARSQQSPAPDVYDTVKAEFDRAYYLRRYADVAKGGLDPVAHYLQHGARAGRDPSPAFATRYYLNRYPDVRQSGLNPFFHYLTVGRPEGRSGTPLSAGDPAFDTFCDGLGRASAEADRDLRRRRDDLRARLETGTLGKMIARAGDLEPMVLHSWPAAMMTQVLPFFSDEKMAQVVAIDRLQSAAEHRRARVTIVVPRCRWGGAPRMEGHLAGAIANLWGPEEVVVVRTDDAGIRFPERFPKGCRHVDLAGACEGLGSHARQRVLVEFLRSLRPTAIFNVNSKLFWETMRPYGKLLSSGSALYAALFCSDQDIYGQWTGYPIKQFYRYFDTYSAVITDSHFLADELRRRYAIPPAQAHKLRTLETPVIKEFPPVAKTSTGERAQIFWAGRFDRQKRVDVVMALAKRLPEVDFHLWGEPVLDKDFQNLDIPKNVALHGVYQDFEELPLAQCDLWLYTSQWDGVPNVLLEVAASGIPIVGSLVGGTGEVLLEGLSHRIEDNDDLDAFETAIRDVLADPAAARKRAAQLRENVLTTRTPSAYAAAVKTLLSAAAGTK